LKKKTLLLFAWIIAVAIGFTFTLAPINFQIVNSEFGTLDSGIPRAAIIDQLHNDKPNEEFQNKSIELLSNAGYKVDLYTTDEITIDFYKQLPSMNYEYILIRSHAVGGALLMIDTSALVLAGIETNSVWLALFLVSGVAVIAFQFRSKKKA